MANTNFERPTLKSEPETSSPAEVAIRDAEGLLWDEFDRLCRGIGVSALAENLVGSDRRRLQIEARWGGDHLRQPT